MSKGQNRTKKKSATQIVAGAVAALLALVMLMSLFGGLLGAGAATVTQKTVDDLKKKLSNAGEEKKKIQNELAEIAGDKSKLKKLIESIDAQIALTEEEIELQLELIAELERLIADKQIELADSQKQEEDQYERLRQRIRFMYENGSMSYLEILLSAEDFYDFLAKYEIVSQLSAYEKSLLDEFARIKEHVAQQKLELELDREDQLEQERQLEQRRGELDKQLGEQQALMKDLEDQEKDYKAAFEEIEKEEERINAEIKKAVAELAKAKEYVGGAFKWPLPGYTTITCVFGMRIHPITGKYSMHTGTDIGAPKGAKIIAANSGTVITATYSTAYGNYVVINHGGGIATLYAHMSKMAVKKGDVVERGQVIGYVGSTGYSTGPHLHFEIIKDGVNIDPMKEFKSLSN